MTFFGKNLQALLNKTGVTPYALAAHLNTEPSTVYRWLNPEVATTPRSRTRVAIAELFGVDPNRLVSGPMNVEDVELNSEDETKLKKRSYRGSRIPVVDLNESLWLAAWFSDDISTENNELVPGATEWLPAAPDLDLPQENLIATRATGSAMAPTILAGDLVYILFDFAGTLSVPYINEGDIVLAYPEGKDSNTPILRKLVYGDSVHDKWLAATNPDFPGTRTIKAGAIVGKAVSIYRKL